MAFDPAIQYRETISKAAGQSFGTQTQDDVQEEIDRCPLCQANVPRADAHACSRIVDYTPEQLAQIAALPPRV